MTSNGELQQRVKESNEAHIERLRDVVRERKETAQSAYELKRHLEDTILAATKSGAAAATRNELHRALRKACFDLGVARGQVDVAESYLVIALNS